MADDNKLMVWAGKCRAFVVLIVSILSYPSSLGTVIQVSPISAIESRSWPAFRVTNEGGFIYRSRSEDESETDYFFVRDPRSKPIRLGVGPDAQIKKFWFSSDHSKFYYFTDLAGQHRLFALTVEGELTAPRQILEISQDEGISSIAETRMSEDESRLFYRAHPNTVTENLTDRRRGKMYVVALNSEGSPPVCIDPQFKIPADGLEHIQISTDGLRFAYLRTNRPPGYASYQELVAVSSTENTLVVLSGSRAVRSFQLTPDGSKIIYTADSVSGGLDLFIVDSQGGPSRRLESSSGRFSVIEDGKRVIYVTPEVNEEPAYWFSYSVESETATRLTDIEVSLEPDRFHVDWASPFTDRYQLTDDDKWLVFTVAGGGVATVNLETNQAYRVSTTAVRAAIAPDGRTLLLVDYEQLFASELNGDGLKAIGPVPTGENLGWQNYFSTAVNEIQFSPDGSHMFLLVTTYRSFGNGSDAMLYDLSEGGAYIVVSDNDTRADPSIEDSSGPDFFNYHVGSDLVRVHFDREPSNIDRTFPLLRSETVLRTSDYKNFVVSSGGLWGIGLSGGKVMRISTTGEEPRILSPLSHRIDKPMVSFDEAYVFYLIYTGSGYTLYAAPTSPANCIDLSLLTDFTAYSEAFALSGGFNGDADGDGLSNGMEFALRHDPTFGGADPKFVSLARDQNGGADEFSVFLRPGLGIAENVRICLEISEDLSGWEMLGWREPNGTWAPEMVLSIEDGLLKASAYRYQPTSRCFYRLRAELVEPVDASD